MCKRYYFGFRKPVSLIVSLLFTIMSIGCTNDPVTGNEDFNQGLRSLCLTEIHYHPLEHESIIDDSLEFLEIKNTGTESLDLSSLSFSQGIDFSFPSGSTLAPNDFFVIASNKNAFKTRYGFDPDDVYSGQLKNSGEEIELKDRASSVTIFSIAYSDSGSWPGSADGDGYSLVPKNPQTKTTDADSEAWRASTKLHGSPGADDVLKDVDSTLFNLRITEIHYHPNHADTAIQDSLEFIELKNVGTMELDLSGVAIDSAIDYKFDTGVKLAPGKFIVLASSSEWFKKEYGFDAFDDYKGQLKNSTETIVIKDKKADVTLLSITYVDGNPWPNEPDGEGPSLVPMNANPAADEQNSPAAWRASFNDKGSPGRDDPEAILINEILPHTDPPQLDAIELYNPGATDVDIGGWFLSDDITVPAKYTIPEGTIIKAGGYKVFTEEDFNENTNGIAFKLSENGEEVILTADTTGNAGYSHYVKFGALELGVSYGRYIVPSTGNELFTPLANVTLDSKNSDPLVGSLVISEIMFTSADEDASFIELTNAGNQEVTLYDPKYPDNTWRVQIETVFFLFPKEKTIKAGESIILLAGSLSVEEFKNKYPASADAQIFSVNTAAFASDKSLKIELEKPMELDKDASGTIISDKVEYMEYDKVSYKNESPWPVLTGSNSRVSLTRIAHNKFGNDPSNWKSAAPSPGN
ncbi:MAG: lamin tail domain-containing protein [Fibrobacter sp.]|nr:lamin tail domain-containing protein [Fibrobacter sp.]